MELIPVLLLHTAKGLWEPEGSASSNEIWQHKDAAWQNSGQIIHITRCCVLMSIHQFLLQSLHPVCSHGAKNTSAL